MENMPEDNTLCLGLPIPRSIRSLLPIVHIPTQSATANNHVMALIRDFGKQCARSEDEIERAVELAAGYDDVVVLLDRPAKDHDYTLPFDEFVSKSTTLRCIDDIIGFISHGSRSIKDTCVLDAFAFSPLGRGRAPPADACLKLAEDILVIKKPDSVLTGSNNKMLASHPLQGCDVSSAPLLSSCRIRTEEIYLIRCFHPGYCVNRVPFYPRARLVLLLAFLLAFTSENIDREKIMDIVRHVRSKGSTSDSSLGTVAATRQLWTILIDVHDVHDECFITVQDLRSKVDIVSQQSQDHMFDLLWTLDWVKRTDVPFDLMTALLLWQKFWDGHFLQQRFSKSITHLLLKQKFPWEQRADLDENLHNLSLCTAKRHPLDGARARYRKVRRAEERRQDDAREDESLKNWAHSVSRQERKLQLHIQLLARLGLSKPTGNEKRKDWRHQDGVAGVTTDKNEIEEDKRKDEETRDVETSDDEANNDMRNNENAALTLACGYLSTIEQALALIHEA